MSDLGNAIANAVVTSMIVLVVVTIVGTVLVVLGTEQLIPFLMSHIHFS